MTRTPIWRRYARLFGADPAADVADEVRFHLDAHVDELVKRGWEPEAARREAEQRFGNVGAVQQTGVRMRQVHARTQAQTDRWEGYLQDLLFAFRTLRRDRSFSIITILVLGLGIAGNTTVFSVVNAMLLRPLPFADPEELAWLASGRRTNPKGTSDLSNSTYTVAAYEEIQRRNQSFRSLTTYNPFLSESDFTLTGRGEPQPMAGVMVAVNFFQTLGVRPARGRLFGAEESGTGGRPAVLLTHDTWRRLFAADPGIIGTGITLGSQTMTVVGVLPKTFDFGAVFAPGLRIDVFVPAPLDQLRDSGNTLALVGRLKPGVSIKQAQAEADILLPAIHAAHQDWWGDYTSTISSLRDHVSGKLRQSLLVLWAAVGLMLLIVGVNLSNLVMARAAARSSEFAMRIALGAGRWRVLRQLLVESLVLSVGGAVVGIGIAYAVTSSLAHQTAITLPLLSQIRIDGAALAWTLLLAAIAAVVLGLAPGLGISTTELQATLKNTGAGPSGAGKRERTLATLVVSQVAMTCVLLIAAGLLLRSFQKVLDVDLGFEPSRAAVMRVEYNDGGSHERRATTLQDILSRITSLPGIETAGIADMLPLGRNRSWGLGAIGTEAKQGDNVTPIVRVVTPGYLGAMGIRLAGGRDFSWRDGPSNEPVVVLNQAAARRLWPGQDPVGRLALLNGNLKTTIIGVVADVRDHSLELAPGPEMYLSAAQTYPDGAELVVRTALPAAVISKSIMTVLRELNPSQPAVALRPIQQIVDQAVSPRRFVMALVASFAGFGLLLASLGVYGVISYAVSRRTREIGLRMALGATAGQVQLSVIGNALRLAAIGVGFGVVGALAAAKGIESLLFATNPTDPVVFGGIVLLLGAVALMAGYLPASRASRVHPVTALRSY